MQKFAKMLVTVGAAAAVIVMSGCASMGNERLAEQSQSSLQKQFSEGKTTKADVQSALGPATKVSFTDSGNEIWSYSWAHATPQARNFIPVVGLFSRGHDVARKELTVMFDRNGVVSRFSMNESMDVVKSGIVH